MDKIQIVNWLLTRRCNLKCDYCSIVRNYKGIPKEYPDIKHYIKDEMNPVYILESLQKLKEHNPNMFHIFYGGEPLLRQDLPGIINYCNRENIHYTIITNNSEEVQPMLENLMLRTSYITGLTSSVDPVIFDESLKGGDIVKKSTEGLKRLISYKDIIKDLVAEITVTSKTQKYLYPLVCELSKNGISSSITFIDPSKSPYYDFSNVTDEDLLMNKNEELINILNRIIEEKLDVHFPNLLNTKIYDSLPSNLDCKIENNIHNLTVDADGSVRLCLRIRGVETPKIKIGECIMKDGSLRPDLKRTMSRDKKNYCRLCNWTCMIMSEYITKNENNIDKLLHSEKREL